MLHTDKKNVNADSELTVNLSIKVIVIWCSFTAVLTDSMVYQAVFGRDLGVAVVALRLL